MARNPVTLALPPFTGVTRRLVLALVAVYFAVLLLSFSNGLAALIVDQTMLHPDRALGLAVWQFFTYAFQNPGLISLLLACISLWFFGAALEEERGGRWMAEYFFVTTAGGALLACILSRTVLAHVPELGPTSRASGVWPAVLALVLAYARFHPDQELRFNFILGLKAKYLAAIYLLIYLAGTLTGGARFDAEVALCAALCGFLYLRLAPQRGLRYAAGQNLYGWRNAYYRWKRQRAARKFTVYMKKHGKDVNLDPTGRYISLDEEERRAREERNSGKPRDQRKPNDRGWMN